MNSHVIVTKNCQTINRNFRAGDVTARSSTNTISRALKKTRLVSNFDSLRDLELIFVFVPILGSRTRLSQFSAAKSQSCINLENERVTYTLFRLLSLLFKLVKF